MKDNSCCSAQVSLVPTPQNYAPGLSALTQRRNDYSQSLERMLANIPRYAVDPNQPNNRPLAALTTRESDDPAIAFLYAWAVVLDVLDFYQLRLLNEFYLRTATEQRSILELARAIGYEFSPGVAASTWLTFTVDTTLDNVNGVTVAQGTQVQSIPGQGTTPQTFETQNDLIAYAELNELYPYQPKISVPQVITAANLQLILAGVATRIQIGDPILLTGTDGNGTPQQFLLTVNAVNVNNTQGYTTITWNESLGNVVFPLQNLNVYRLSQMGCFGHNAPSYYSMSTDFQAKLKDWDKYPPLVWQDPNVSTGQDYPPYDNANLYLDQTFTQILPNGWIILQDPTVAESAPTFYQVTSVHTESLVGFGLSGTVTGLKLEGFDIKTAADFGFRTATIYVQSQSLTLYVPQQVDQKYYPIQGNKITLNVVVTSLQVGQHLILSGTTLDPNTLNPQSTAVEVITLIGISQDTENSSTVLSLQNPLSNIYDPSTVTILGNAVQATHGSTVANEVLGSGDGSTANQSFTLKKPQLTFLPAVNAQGIADTLQLRVNGILWHEVESLYDQPANSQVYIVRQDDEGYSTVTFGDGINGARLPTGTENVQATYRVGLGPAGEVAANTLSLLRTRPLGIKGVNNALAATGAAAPEDVTEARRNAPLTAFTLQRIVSLDDYSSFAQAFTGIGKAQTVVLKPGQRPIIFITLAGENGDPVPSDSMLYTSLQQVIKSISVPGQSVVLGSYQALYFNVTAQLLIDPNYIATTVLSNAEAQLQQTFSFANRDFAQAVAATDVINALQDVPGVIAVQLSAFYFSTATPSLQSILSALPARVDSDNVTLLPAQLLTLNLAGMDLTEMKV